MNWAWEQKLAPSPKLILMALADAADDSGECWPRLRTIAAKCCTSERTVQRVLKEFEATRLLAVTRRFTSEGRQTSNGYRLSLKPYPDKLSPSRSTRQGEGDTDDTGRVTQLCRPGGDIATSSLEPPLNTSGEPPPQPTATASELRLHFPDRLGGCDRAAVEALLKGIDAAIAQVLLDELAGAMETPSTIKTTPVRWFRALTERLQQGRFAPSAGVHVAERRASEQTRRIERARVEREQAAQASMTPDERSAIRQRLAAVRSKLLQPKEPASVARGPERRR
jgi:hypothetical protein